MFRDEIRQSTVVVLYYDQNPTYISVQSIVSSVSLTKSLVNDSLSLHKYASFCLQNVSLHFSAKNGSVFCIQYV